MSISWYLGQHWLRSPSPKYSLPLTLTTLVEDVPYIDTFKRASWNAVNYALLHSDVRKYVSNSSSSTHEKYPSYVGEHGRWLIYSWHDSHWLHLNAIIDLDFIQWCKTIRFTFMHLADGGHLWNSSLFQSFKYSSCLFSKAVHQACNSVPYLKSSMKSNNCLTTNFVSKHSNHDKHNKFFPLRTLKKHIQNWNTSLLFRRWYLFCTFTFSHSY